MSFESLNLDPQILRALSSVGYTTPTPIQAKSIPVIMEGHDLMASAQTGTGKTAAFILPALNLLATPHLVKDRGPRILVLTPTRELAAQINEAARKYGTFIKAKTTSIVGGMPYPLQNKLLSQPLDILIATPGRLLDHMERGRINLSRLQMLVLDEADRMLDMGFIPDVKKICAAINTKHQTLLFSATLDGQISKIAKDLLSNPKTIEISHSKEKHENITQNMYFVDNLNHKNKLLEHILIQPGVKQTIIFTSTKRHADLLADELYNAGHKTGALHGDMTQGARNRTLTKFRHGDISVLVATDVAARGIDVDGITHVINYDLPKFAEDYVHRIGRTGRAKKEGVAISFVAPMDGKALRDIEKYTGHKIDTKVMAGFEPKVQSRDQLGEERKSKSRGGKRSFGDKKSFGDRKPFGEKKSFGDKKLFRKDFGSPYAPKRDSEPRMPRSPFEKKAVEKRLFGKTSDKKPRFSRVVSDKKTFGEKKSFGDRKPSDRKTSDRKPAAKRESAPKTFAKKLSSIRTFRASDSKSEPPKRKARV
ncbi:SrmB Superfamily II DNA and RNA helicases [Candidatus Methylopumilus planktonicus]|uniref:DEAD/DEAH box helicase n=1 Tax=Candidatus Methylopumilus planktonicus TaxID=1581557 RepID=UPI003BEF03F7